MIFIVVMQEAIRKVIIVNPKRQVGNKVYGGVNTFIPFKLNPGGVMPIIFAVAILLFPSTILSLVGQANLPAGFVQDMFMVLNKIFNPSGATYYVIYFLMIVALTFFYASIIPSIKPNMIAIPASINKSILSIKVSTINNTASTIVGTSSGKLSAIPITNANNICIPEFIICGNILVNIFTNSGTIVDKL
jgi:preprotein translocase subunit SecY